MTDQLKNPEGKVCAPPDEGTRVSVAEVLQRDLQPFLTEFGDKETRDLCEWWGSELRIIIAEVSHLFSIRLIQHQNGSEKKALRNIVTYASPEDHALAEELVLNEIPLTKENSSSMAKAALRDEPTVMLFKPEKEQDSRVEILEGDLNVAVRDITPQTFEKMKTVKTAGFENALCIPCEKIGLITAYLEKNVDYREPRIAEVIRRVQEINAKFADKLENLNNHKVLARCLELANQAGGLKNILPELLRTITEYGPITDASIAFWDDQNGKSRTQMEARYPPHGDARDEDPGDLVQNRGLIQRVKEGNEPFILVDAADKSEENKAMLVYLGEMIEQNGIKKILALPLFGENGKRIGALVIDGHHEKSFEPKEIKHFQNAAGALSLLITKEHAKEREQKTKEESDALRHELANVQIVIGGYLNRMDKMLKKELADLGKLKEYREQIAKLNQKAQEIIILLGMMAKKENLHLESATTTQIGNRLMEQVRTLKEDCSGEKVLTCDFSTTDPDELTNHPVAIDPTAIDQIASNLIRNAICHRKDEKSVASIKINLRSDPEKKNLLLIFSNPGGIPDELIANGELFKSYVTTKKGRGGTGLGLAICKKCVELMGGTISVKSENGEVTFTVALPFVQLSESSGA